MSVPVVHLSRRSSFSASHRLYTGDLFVEYFGESA